MLPNENSVICWQKRNPESRPSTDTPLEDRDREMPSTKAKRVAHVAEKCSPVLVIVKSLLLRKRRQSR